VHESLDDVGRAMAGAQDEGGAARVVEPLRISVPATGVHFAFDKLYANQGEEQAWFAITYASAVGARTGTAASLLATILLWSGVVTLLGWRPLMGRRAAVVCVASGVLVITVAAAFYKVGLTPAITLSVLIAMGLAAWRSWWWWRQRELGSAVSSEAPSSAGHV
jgi:hypothetical protein